MCQGINVRSLKKPLKLCQRPLITKIIKDYRDFSRRKLITVIYVLIAVIRELCIFLDFSRALNVSECQRKNFDTLIP